MRKSSKSTVISVNVARQQGYHERDEYSSNYAYQGFGENRYFTSDRFIKLDSNFNRPDGKPLVGYGLEIETENRAIGSSDIRAEVLNSVVFKYFPEHLFKMQDDSSLNNGTECITQVMTKEFIRNNYPTFKLMYDTYFKALSFTCGTNCGMHTNISLACFGRDAKTQADAVRKLYYIINRHYDAMCIMVNRERAYTRYCARMSYESAKAMDLTGFGSSHGVCFNLGHYNEGRIELRLVGGQKNFACFRNTMETIFHLVDRVKTISWKNCDSLEEVFKGCNKYVYDRFTKVYNAGLVDESTLNSVKASQDLTVEYI